jgi:carboxymethylenebutenolidase
MCYDSGARPPIPPIAGAALDGQDLTLTSGDGTRFAAYVARAVQPAGTGVVILPDVRGLHTFYIELAQRFAEHGSHAIAIDYFGRTAGASRRGDDFDYMPHVQQIRPDHVRQEVAAALAHLREPEGGAALSFFTVGFCFGGGYSWLQAAAGQGLKGAIGFYGRPGSNPRTGAPGPIEQVRSMSCPILGLFGGADQAISQSDIAAFDQALTDARVEHEFHVYPGAPHSFFDRRATEYAEASADAWRRVLDFIARDSVMHAMHGHA